MPLSAMKRVGRRQQSEESGDLPMIRVLIFDFRVKGQRLYGTIVSLQVWFLHLSQLNSYAIRYLFSVCHFVAVDNNGAVTRLCRA